jgi:hypothetical protein
MRSDERTAYAITISGITIAKTSNISTMFSLPLTAYCFIFWHLLIETATDLGIVIIKVSDR